MLHIYYDICNENTVSCFTEKAQWTRYRTIRIYLTQLHKPLSHIAVLTLRPHDVLFQSAGKSHGNLPFFLKMAMSRRSHCLSMAISRRPWRFYGAPWRSFGVLVGNFVALSRHFHCGVYRVVTARALRVHGPASAENAYRQAVALLDGAVAPRSMRPRDVQWRSHCVATALLTFPRRAGRRFGLF